MGGAKRDRKEMMTRCVLRAALALVLLVGGDARFIGGSKRTPEPASPTAVVPKIVSSSHNIPGYGPECATDGNDETFWLVPGGQRMEMMSRDKWLVLDLGGTRTVHALSLLGIVDSFGSARMRLEVGSSPSGPWLPVHSFRALGTPLRWQRIELGGLGHTTPSARFFRLFVRREGHATFKHRVMGVTMHCDAESVE